MPAGESSDTPPGRPSAEAVALVHRGWDHLRRQRPLAAWACWQRALRVEPGNAAAAQALERLADAEELPAVARIPRRFRAPGDEARRARWDAALRGRDASDLEIAADAFESLADADPGDADARFNQALCLAWLGRNPESIEALDAFVRIAAASAPEDAAAAWTLAEILRHGGGAETLADDFSHALTIDDLDVGESDGALAALGRAEALRPLPAPDIPGVDLPVRVFEWLDRPFADVDPDAALAPADLPRLLATASAAPRVLRFFGPDPLGLDEARARLLGVVDLDPAAIRRTATPLPLGLLDAAAWTFRLPPGLGEDARNRASRVAVESYYEVTWIGLPRRGLDGLTPAAASAASAAGDAALRAKLAGLVAFREQLGARPRTLPLYQGYPFDRLRRRLGLEPRDPATVDPADPSCMSGPELDSLDPAALDESALADALTSAVALRDDARAARFAAALVALGPSALARRDARAVFAALVRQSLGRDDPAAALAWIDRAIAEDTGLDRRTYATWRAEVLARAGDPDAASAAYDAILADSPDAALALDAAETLIDNGHDDHAAPFARLAAGLARASGDEGLADRAESILP